MQICISRAHKDHITAFIDGHEDRSSLVPRNEKAFDALLMDVLYDLSKIDSRYAFLRHLEEHMIQTRLDSVMEYLHSIILVNDVLTSPDKPQVLNSAGSFGKL